MKSPPSLDPEQTLDIVLESLADLVDYELAVILGVGPRGQLTVRKARGPLSSEKLEGAQISPLAQAGLQRVLDSRVPYLFSESEGHVDAYHGILDLPEGHSCLVAPLYVQEKPLGLLTLDHRVCGRFTPGIVQFVASMSKLVSMAVAQADSNRDLREANESLAVERNQLLSNSAPAFAGLIGASPAWKAVLDQIRLAAPGDLPILILGETGTGKEGVARALHQLSTRRTRPFVAVNCSSLSEGLAESELFGHEKGAFTGALGLRRGRFELADGGTLFLDEIGDLPLALQPKLLRVIQQGTLERVGGEATISVDVRVVAATHVDLPKAIREGKFREDLYYRLNVFALNLPPLRKRPGDVVLLVRHFLATMQSRGWEGLSISSPALAILEAKTWGGNVRELENLLERAAVLARGTQILPSHLAPPQGDHVCLDPEVPGEPGPIVGWNEATKAILKRALDASDGRIYGPGGAADLLGLKPSTLQSKMKRLNLATNPKS